MFASFWTDSTQKFGVFVSFKKNPEETLENHGFCNVFCISATDSKQKYVQLCFEPV